MAYFTVDRSVMPCKRSSSNSSSSVNRVLAISRCKIAPWSMMTLGRPQRRLRRVTLLRERTDRSMVREKRVMMGMRP